MSLKETCFSARAPIFHAPPGENPKGADNIRNSMSLSLKSRCDRGIRKKCMDVNQIVIYRVLGLSNG